MATAREELANRQVIAESSGVPISAEELKHLQVMCEEKTILSPRPRGEGDEGEDAAKSKSKSKEETAAAGKGEDAKKGQGEPLDFD